MQFRLAQSTAVTFPLKGTNFADTFVALGGFIDRVWQNKGASVQEHSSDPAVFIGIQWVPDTEFCKETARSEFFISI
jgi:hypothetical protein